MFLVCTFHVLYIFSDALLRISQSDDKLNRKLKKNKDFFFLNRLVYDKEKHLIKRCSFKQLFQNILILIYNDIYANDDY